MFDLAELSAACFTDEEIEEYNLTEQRESCLIEHSIHLKRTELFLFYISITLLSCFVLEVFVSLYTFRWKYFRNPLYLLDGSIVIASFIMEICFHYGDLGHAKRAASAIMILRLWKIVRAVHAVAHSLTMKNRLLIKKIEEAKVILEEERVQIEEILEKQNIKVDFYVHLLINLGKLPSKEQVEKYVNEISMKRKEIRTL